MAKTSAPASTQDRVGRGAFSVVTVLVLIAIGIFSFSAFITLTTFAPDWTRGSDGRAHALSHSAIGFAGVVTLERARGANITVSRSRPRYSVSSRNGRPIVGEGAPLVVITPDRPVTEDEIYEVAHRRVLLVLPKWQAFPSPGNQSWVTKIGVMEPAQIEEFLATLAPKAKIVHSDGAPRPSLHYPADRGSRVEQTIEAGPISLLQSLEGEGFTPVVTDASGHVILASIEGENQLIFVLADPDFLNTQGISDLNTARAGVAMLDLIRDPGAPLAFDVTLNGFIRTRSILRTAFEPPFLAATLSLVAAALLLGWRAIVRSGPSQRETRAFALGKRALAENSAALIRTTGREAKMGAPYAAMTGDATAEQIGLPRDEKELAAKLDATGAAKKVSVSFSDLMAEATRARSRADVLKAATKLYDWSKEIVRATR